MNPKDTEIRKKKLRNYNNDQSDSKSDKENQKIDDNIIGDRPKPGDKVIKAIKTLSSDQFLNNFDVAKSAFKDTSHSSNSKVSKSLIIEDTKDCQYQNHLFQNLKPLNDVLKEIQSNPPFLFF
jgi:hypothetical protein